MNVLFDTCIVIDALQSRQPFAGQAQTLFLLAATHRINGFLTAKACTDIYYLTHHYTHDEQQSRQVVDKLFSLFTVLDTAADDLTRALPSKMPDFEDALMVETALRSGVDAVVTRNLDDYRQAAITVYAPGELIALINNEEE